MSTLKLIDIEFYWRKTSQELIVGNEILTVLLRERLDLKRRAPAERRSFGKCP